MCSPGSNVAARAWTCPTIRMITLSNSNLPHSCSDLGAKGAAQPQAIDLRRIEELSSLDLSTRAQGDSKSGIEVLTCPRQESRDRNAVGDSVAGVRRPGTTTGRRRCSVPPVRVQGTAWKIVDRPLLLDLASSISGNSPGTRSGHRGFGQVRPGRIGSGGLNYWHG